MQKHLLLLIAFIFFTGSFLCRAQANRPAARSGTLTTSQQSGGGANGPFCRVSVDLTNLSLLNPFTATLCLNSDSIRLQGLIESDFGENEGTWYYTDFNSPLPTFENSVAVKKPGVYLFESACGAVGISITSIIPLDLIPSVTTLCPEGSVALNAPIGTFSGYQWYKDSELIQGENSNSYVASKSGNYFVQTTNAADGCVLNTDKINLTVYTPPSQLNITHIAADNSGKYLFIKQRMPYSSGPFGRNHYPGTIGTAPDVTIEKYTGYVCANSYLVLDNNESDLNPETVTWYRNGNIIKKIDGKGIVIAGGNGVGSELNQFNQPYGIFVDSIKNIYVADYNNYRIMKWMPGSTSGEVVTGNLNLLGGNPTNVLLDGQSLYISTTSDILQFSPPFNINKLFNGNGWGLSINSERNLYFASSGSVYKINSNGDTDLVATGSDINGIYVDSLSSLYIADNLIDSFNNYYSTIVKWIPGAMTAELIAGGKSHGNAPNQIWFSAGIAFDKTGNLYISDAENRRVQVWKPGADHGITIASGFTPWGIQVDDSDNVYVADQTNNRVLKFPSLLHNTIKADLPGVYKAVLTYPGGCSTTSNDFLVNDCFSPVRLLSFEGRLKNNHTVLTWQTASEYNAAYFNVQRSRDGVNFTTLGKVSASGSSSSLHNYLYNDNDITHLDVNKIYYRVIESDIAGRSLQNNVILIDVKKPGWSFTISPNPVKSSLKVHLNNLSGGTNVALIDMTGRQLTVQQINTPGNNVLNFNMDALAGGLYLIRVINGGQTKYLKFVKE